MFLQCILKVICNTIAYSLSSEFNSVLFLKIFRYLHLWPLDSLLRSNSNLHEINPSRLSEASKYVIPEGGLQEGLCSQILILSKKEKKYSGQRPS